MAEIDVNMPDEERQGCSCDRKQWPNVMAALTVVAMGLLILVAVLNLMNFRDGIPGVMLDVYVIVLALFGVMTEARMFKALRSTIYVVIKYVYFLVSYTPRSLYYIFLGSIILDPTSPLMLIVSIYCMVIGVMYMVLNFIFKFPKYLDWQVVKAEQEEKLRREVEKRFAATPTPNAAAVAGAPLAYATAAPVPAPGNPYSDGLGGGAGTNSKQYRDDVYNPPTI